MDDDQAPDEDILDAYRAAEDPHQWLFTELVDYFGDTESVAELFDNLEARLEQFHDSAADPDLPLGFDVFVHHREGPSSRLLLRELPHPVELLWVLCENAQPGDTVAVDHHYTDHVVSASAVWPFSIHDAELLTSPDLAQDDRALELGRQDPGDGRQGPELAIDSALVGVVTGAVVALAGVALGRLSALRRR